MHGCTNESYEGYNNLYVNCNPHLIKKYEYNGEIFEGMPQFDNIDDLIMCHKLKILEVFCARNCEEVFKFNNL